MKKKMGRPRLSSKGLSVVFSVRLPPDETRIVTDAIRASGQAKPDWLRGVILAAARRK